MTTPAGAWRVGDADRQAAVEALGEHYATGRLDRPEFDARSERAWSATYDHDLTGLFADLPHPHGAVMGAAPRPAARAVGRRTPPYPGRRFPLPFGPLLFVGIVLAVVLHAFWLVWLVPAFFWLVVRPARRQGWQRRALR